MTFLIASTRQIGMSIAEYMERQGEFDPSVPGGRGNNLVIVTTCGDAGTIAKLVGCDPEYVLVSKEWRSGALARQVEQEFSIRGVSLDDADVVDY